MLFLGFVILKIYELKVEISCVWTFFKYTVRSHLYQTAVKSTFRYINRFVWNRFTLFNNVMTQLYQDSLISTLRF